MFNEYRLMVVKNGQFEDEWLNGKIHNIIAMGQSRSWRPSLTSLLLAFLPKKWMVSWYIGISPLVDYPLCVTINQLVHQY